MSEQRKQLLQIVYLSEEGLGSFKMFEADTKVMRIIDLSLSLSLARSRSRSLYLSVCKSNICIENMRKIGKWPQTESDCC